ncbi:MAG: BrnT family toxin [Planctomycetota bacterium]
MQFIRRLEWDDTNTDHIAEHGVTVEEVEEVCFSRPLLLKSRRETRLVFGRTADGAYLLVVVRLKEKGMARCITARPMTAKEKRYFLRRRRPT